MDKIEINREYHKFHYVSMLRASSKLCLLLQMQGSKKVPFGRPGRVGFLVGQVTLCFKRIIA